MDSYLYFSDKVLTLKITGRRTEREDCHVGWTVILKERNIT
jgi:hypothetical protein